MNAIDWSNYFDSLFRRGLAGVREPAERKIAMADRAQLRAENLVDFAAQQKILRVNQQKLAEKNLEYSLTQYKNRQQADLDHFNSLKGAEREQFRKDKAAALGLPENASMTQIHAAELERAKSDALEMARNGVDIANLQANAQLDGASGVGKLRNQERADRLQLATAPAMAGVGAQVALTTAQKQAYDTAINQPDDYYDRQVIAKLLADPLTSEKDIATIGQHMDAPELAIQKLSKDAKGKIPGLRVVVKEEQALRAASMATPSMDMIRSYATLGGVTGAAPISAGGVSTPQIGTPETIVPTQDDVINQMAAGLTGGNPVNPGRVNPGNPGSRGYGNPPPPPPASTPNYAQAELLRQRTADLVQQGYPLQVARQMAALGGPQMQRWQRFTNNLNKHNRVQRQRNQEALLRLNAPLLEQPIPPAMMGAPLPPVVVPFQ